MRLTQSQKNWDTIKYCSDSCRKHKIMPNSLDTVFESKILSLLTTRRATLGAAALVTCEEAEDEALKEEASSIDVDGNENGTSTSQKEKHSRIRERCRQAARRLAAKGEILVTQNGQVVDPSFAKGTMELRLPE